MLANSLIMDSNREEAKDFLIGLKQSTGLSWECDIYKNNKKYGLTRYLKFFLVGFKIFLFRHQNEKLVFWQQYYGIAFAMFCRLFHVRKTVSVTVMTFIFKSKSGLLGRIKKKFVKYCIESDYIDHIICTSSAEVPKYAATFELPTSKFAFVRWGALDYLNHFDQINNLPLDMASGKYIFSTGRSNRDYSFLIDSLIDKDDKMLIATDQLKEGQYGSNIFVDNHLFNDDMLKVMANAWCVVIALEDPTIASGQLVLLHAMNLGIPVILTKSEGVTDDYVIDGLTGLVIRKNTKDLLQTLRELHNNPELYKRLSVNSKKYFSENFTKKILGNNIGKVVVSTEEGG